MRTTKSRYKINMKIKEMLKKIGEMDSNHFSLIIEGGIIISKLEKEEQDKLMELIDLIIEYQKKKLTTGGTE